MKIAGLQKQSFVDYPHRIAAVIFTQGCNMECYYCHNKELLKENAPGKFPVLNEVLGFLWERRSFLDGIVVSGGEPTLQPDLAEFIFEIKKRGYPVKLDTNGTRPGILKKLLDSKLLDYVAMDLKAPLEKYRLISGNRVETDKIRESIRILMEGTVDYEFRTTLVSPLTEEDIFRMAHEIKGAQKYVLQQYRIPAGERDRQKGLLQVVPFNRESVLKMTEKIKGMVKQCETRGFGGE